MIPLDVPPGPDPGQPLLWFTIVVVVIIVIAFIALLGVARSRRRQ